MSEILKVKITVPPIKNGIQPKQQLSERFHTGCSYHQGFSCFLTLVSAPARFGKTTAVRSWLANREDHSAWYSLDHSDNDRAIFWRSLVSCLENVSKNIGAGTLGILYSNDVSSEPPSVLLTPLLNDLFELDDPIYLVIDDYHFISHPQIHEDLKFLIENCPPSLHIILTTRSDPPWPLARYRARGIMQEIRMQDLTFSPEESNELLKKIIGTDLSDEQLQMIYDKTEGWIAGLQLSALSLANRPDINDFLKIIGQSPLCSSFPKRRNSFRTAT